MRSGAPQYELRAAGVPPQQEKRGAQRLPGSLFGYVAVIMKLSIWRRAQIHQAKFFG